MGTTRWQQLQTQLRRLFGLNRSDSELHEFLLEARRTSVNASLGLGAFTLFASIAWWPTDFMFFRNEPELLHAFGRWRIAVSIISIVWMALLWYGGAFVTRFVFPLATLTMAATSAVIAFSLAPFGGVDAPWFHAIYVVTLTTPLLLMPILPRIAATGFLAAVWIVTYFVQRPDLMQHGHMGSAFAMLAFALIAAVVVGHALFALYREYYFKQREFQTSNSELATMLEDQNTQLRKLAAHLHGSQEQERSRLARELHDELGQLLTAMRYGLERSAHLVTADPELASRQLQSLGQTTELALGDLRRLVADLRPSILDDFGLVAAVEWFCEQAEQRSGVTVEARITPPDFTVPTELGTVVYRVLQEAMTNISKHAQATHVIVELDQLPGHVRLKVTDNGIGFTMRVGRRAAGTGGMGVVGMRERVRAFGGIFEMTSAPGVGTTVRVEIPIPETSVP